MLWTHTQDARGDMLGADCRLSLGGCYRALTNVSEALRLQVSTNVKPDGQIGMCVSPTATWIRVFVNHSLYQLGD